MIEIWKDIKNYEGMYQISNYGRVRRDNRLLKLVDKGHNYLVVCFSVAKVQPIFHPAMDLRKNKKWKSVKKKY